MERKDSYLTIRKHSTGNFRDRGSRFLAFAYQIDKVDQVHDILKQLRRKYHDARHHCYAYSLGAAKKICRAYDD